MMLPFYELLDTEEEKNKLHILYQALKYQSSDIGVKESILLDTVPEQASFIFEFKLEGMTVRHNATDEGLTFYDETSGEMVAAMEAPNMNDATEEAYSEALTTKVEEKEGETDTYIVTITADREYLEAEDRIYPVSVDPTITWTGTTDFWDVYVCKGSKYKDINFYDSGIKCLCMGNSSQGVYRTYLRFKEIKKQILGYYVDSAILTFHETEASEKGEQVRIYQVTENWNPSKITWNNRPGYTGATYDKFTSSGKSATKTLDVTKHVRDIANGSISSYGLIMKAVDESSDGKYVQLANSRYTTSSNRPKLKVVYYDPPTTPTVSLPNDKRHYKKGESITVNWSGIKSQSLNHVEYRVAKWDSTNKEETGNIIEYSTSTKIGTTESGSASIGQNWAEGAYKLVIRGVDNGGINGTGRGIIVYVDATAPTLGSVSLTPVTSSSSYSKQAAPTLKWSGASDTYLSGVFYSVNGGVTKTAGTGASGSVTADGNFVSGKNTIKVWTADKAGNRSAEKTLEYYKDVTPPSGGNYTLTASKSADSGYTADNAPKITVTGIAEVHSGMTTSLSGTGVRYAIVPSGTTPGTYQTVPNISFSKTTTPYAYSFTVPMSGKATGIYDVYVTNTDKAGNVSSAGKVTIKRDVTAPTGNIKISSNGGNKDAIVAGTMPAAVTVKDEHSNVKSASLVLLDESGTQVGQALLSGVTASAGTSKNTNVTYDTTTLDNGTYTLKLLLTDGAGNPGTVTQTIRVENQMEAPLVQESYSTDGNFTVRWEFPVEPKHLKEIQYKLPDGTSWISIPDSGEKTGAVSIQLPEKEGIYEVRFRGMDVAGVAGKEMTARCILDQTSPVIETGSFKQGVLNGTVKDSHIKEWNIAIREKGSTDTWKELVQQDQNYEDEVLVSIDLQEEEYKEEHWYEVQITATDKAGNKEVRTLSVYKAGTGSAEEPSYVIGAPSGMEEEKIWTLSGEEKLILRKAEGAPEDLMMDSVTWYLNGIEEAKEDTVIYQGDLTDGERYPEGRGNTILAVVKGKDGKEYLTGRIAQKTYSETIEVTESAQFADLHFGEQLYSFTFWPEEVTDGESSVRYEADMGNGVWKELVPGRIYQIDEFQDAITAEQLQIQAVLEGNARVTGYRIVYQTVEEQDFIVSLFEQYRPRNVTARDKLDYKTYIRWEIAAKDEKNASIIPKTINEVMTLEESDEKKGKIYYELYRGTEKDFTADEAHRVADTIETNYWSSIDVDISEKTYYYRLRAVERDEEGQILRKSHLSNVAASKGVAANEYTKRLGQQEYWGYTDFSTPNGDGMAELSKGNFYYSQNDVSLPNAQLELGLSRNYNSQSTLKTSFGTGWDHNYNLELLKLKDIATGEEKGVVFKDSTGTIYPFLREEYSDTEYHSATDEYVTLTANEGGKEKEKEFVISKDGKEEKGSVPYAYTLHTRGGTSYLFDTVGRLVYEEEANGTYLLFDYEDQSGNLSCVTTEKGRSLTFTYQEETEGDSALVKEIALQDGTKLLYEYGKDKNEIYHLTSVTKKGTEKDENITYTYQYDENGMLDTILDAMKNPYKITYRKDARDGLFYVETMVNPVGETIRFRKDSEKAETETIKETPDGTVLYTTSVRYDGQGYVTSEIDAEGLTATRSYENGVITEETREVSKQAYEEKTGKVTYGTEKKTEVTEYGKRQNPEKETDMLGNVILYRYTTEEETEANRDLATRETETGYDGLLLRDDIYTYDEDGNETYYLDDIEGEESFSQYDEDGNLLWEEWYEYDEEDTNTRSAGEKTKVSETAYQYGDDGTVKEETTKTPETSSTTSYTYDALGRCIRSVTTTGDQVEEIRTEYDYMGRDTKNTVILTKNIQGQEQETKTENTSTIYDANGTVLKEVEKDGTVTTYTYDAMNRVIQRQIQKGNEIRTYRTEYGYEKNLAISQGGEKTKVIPVAYKEVQKQGDKILSTVYKDGAGKTVREISSGITTDYIYDSLGNQIGTVTAGKTTIQVCDSAGNVTETIEEPEVGEENGTIIYSAGNDSIVTHSRYDSRGNVTETTDGMGVTTLYTYDEEGRLEQILTGEKVILGTYTYQSAEGITSTTLEDALGKKNTTLTDTGGRETELIEKDKSGEISIRTMQEYDSTGALKKITYADGSYQEYEQNVGGQTKEIRRYDKNGEKESRTTYTYDLSTDAVLTMIDYEMEEGQEQATRYTGYEYDGFGHVTALIEVDDTEAPTEEQKEKGRITYTYNGEDQLVSITYPESDDKEKGLRFLYNEDGWLTKILIRYRLLEEPLREYSYREDGTISSMKDYTGSGNTYLLKAYEYDTHNRVVGLQVTKDGKEDNVLESYQYAYDKNGNIIKEELVNNTGKEETDWVRETRQHTYDTLGRLTETVYQNQKTEKTVSYSYDTAGNRLTETVQETENPKEETIYTYNGLHQLVDTVTMEAGEETSAKTYTYDAKGNETREKDSIAGSELTYQYDMAGQLKKVTQKQGDTIVAMQQNWYNGSGQRIKKSETICKDTTIASENTRRYFYDGTSVLYTTDEKGNLTTKNYLGLSENAIATRRYQGNYKDKAYFYLKDVRGSVTSIVDEEGEGILSYQYDAFGVTTASGETDFENQICYTGGIYDELTGLYYLNARYYDPEEGRFLTEDTYRGEIDQPDTWHLYVYCANDPVNYTDPSGHMAVAAAATGIGNLVVTLTGSIGVTCLIAALAGTAMVYATKKINKTFIKKAKIQVRLKCISGVEKALRAIEDAKAYSKAIARKWSTDKAKHHIVAKNAWRAKAAKEVLEDYCHMDVVKDPRNLVSISTRLHLGLHTKVYFNGVNKYICHGGSMTKHAILKRLSHLKKALKITDDMINMY